MPNKVRQPKGNAAVGKRVSVYWDTMLESYTGVVKSYDKEKDEYKVKYDVDGKTSFEKLDDMEFVSDTERDGTTASGGEAGSEPPKKKRKAATKNAPIIESSSSDKDGPSSKLRRSSRKKPSKYRAKTKEESSDEESDSGDDEGPRRSTRKRVSTKAILDDDANYMSDGAFNDFVVPDSESSDDASESESKSDSDSGGKRVTRKSTRKKRPVKNYSDVEKTTKGKRQVQKRAAKNKRKKMDEEDEDEDEDDLDDDDDDDEEEVVNGREEYASEAGGDDNEIEKVVAIRHVKKDQADDDEESKEEASKGNGKKEELEYLVKYKNKSYRHVEWLPGTHPSVLLKLKRKIKVPDIDDTPDKVFFPREYKEVEKILDSKGSQYLIKWNGLEYEECTWEELPEEDDEAVAAYLKERQSHLAGKGKKKGKQPTLKVDKNAEPPSFKGERTLKDFQVEGFKWLVFNYTKKRSCILADEMGLGKTMQTIAFLEYLRTKGIEGPHIVIAPLSTLDHWLREAHTWTGLKALVLKGSPESRAMIREHDWKWPDGSYKFNVLITAYDMIYRETTLSRVDWHCFISWFSFRAIGVIFDGGYVIDEAHRVKNVKSALLGLISNYKTEHRLLLTGTPLQNHMKELWSLLHFMEPEQFSSSDKFLEEYGDLKDSEQVEKLHKVLAPHLLRRLKEDVDKSIPIKEEIIINVELTHLQKQYYRAILERSRDFLYRGIKTKANVPKLNNIMMEIRKVCNHLYLIAGARQSTEDSEAHKGRDMLLASSSKLVFLDKLLQKLRQEKKKVLIFSQMVECLDLIEEYLDSKNYPTERLDGTIKASDRQAGIDRFNSKEVDSFVFLLSTRAGGVGINLTAADTVIIYDSDWNPQNDLQAQARCHRIGQTQEVKVYRLITRNTYEQYMLEVAQKKMALGHAVLQVKNADDADDEKKDVDKMLKYGAAELFKEDDKEADQRDTSMMALNIDDVLQQATTIRYTDKTANPKQLTGFSTATFVSDEQSANISINDENFWEKVLPDFVSIHQLQEKIEEAKAVAPSTEAQEQFMTQLDKLISDKQKNASGISVLSSDMLKLLLDVEYSKFDKTFREKAKKIREDLETPRTRTAVLQQQMALHGFAMAKGKKKNKYKDDLPDNFMEDEDFVDDDDEKDAIQDSSESDGEAEGRESKRRKTGKENLSLVAKSTKTKFTGAIVRYGYGRWQKITEATSTASKQPITPMLAQCLGESFVHKFFKESTITEYYKSILRGVFAHTIQSMKNFALSKSTDTTELKFPKDPENVPDEQSLAEVDVTISDKDKEMYPGQQFKVDLTVKGEGVNTKGIYLVAEYLSHSEDAYVRFYSVADNKSMMVAAPGFPGKYVWRCVRPKITGELVQCGQPSIELTVLEHPTFSEDLRSSKSWGKRLDGLWELYQLVYKYGENLEKVHIPSIRGGGTFSAWTPEQDKALLVGYYKHGYGQALEILADPELKLGEFMEQNNLPKPPASDFNNRFFRVLTEINKKKALRLHGLYPTRPATMPNNDNMQVAQGRHDEQDVPQNRNENDNYATSEEEDNLFICITFFTYTTCTGSGPWTERHLRPQSVRLEVGIGSTIRLHIARPKPTTSGLLCVIRSRLSEKQKGFRLVIAIYS